MAVLSSEDRKGMSKSEFAGPGHSFPVNDDNHARMAISGATRSERAGNISSSEEEAIKAKARAKLGEGGGEADPHKEHRVAVAKMHPKHVHELVKHAMTGKAGPEAKKMAGMAMQDGAGAAPPQQGVGSPFSGGGAQDEDDSAPSGGSPFGGN